MGRNRVKKIGFFPGTFDFVHAGHCLAIKEAREQCDYLVIGLQIDPSIDRPEKNSPVMSLNERLTILESNKYVDGIVVYHTEKELKLLDTWLGDIRFMGADHYKKDRKSRAKVIYLSRNHNYSSTNLRKRAYEHFIQSKKNR